MGPSACLSVEAQSAGLGPSEGAHCGPRCAPTTHCWRLDGAYRILPGAALTVSVSPGASQGQKLCLLHGPLPLHPTAKDFTPSASFSLWIGLKRLHFKTCLRSVLYRMKVFFHYLFFLICVYLAAGVKGEKGSWGLPGSKGEKGDPGPQGPPGIPTLVLAIALDFCS